MAQSRSPVAFGPYIITRRIARGGMAEIYRARTRSTAEQGSRWVAVKMMRPSLGHEALREQLFRREARIASAIQHPNVIPLYAFGEEMERHYLAMEYVRGRDLSHLLKADKRGRELLPFELALYVGLQAAAGLGHAHRLLDERGQPMGIVHRDISPGNVMVGYDGAVKVLDFGVARLNESTGMRTQTGTLRGKFAYMSPEQTLGEPLDARSDVFSLGTVLYELLTGANCFRADNPIATLERVQRVRPVPPSRANREVPKSVDRVLARCLAKDKSRRFADCGYLAEALGELLDKRSFDGRAALVRHMHDRFAWEQEEEEKELLREEEEVAIFDVIDFAMVGEDGGLDAPHVAVSLEEEASQSEVHKAQLDQRSSDDEVDVFDEAGEKDEPARDRAGTPAPPGARGRLGAAAPVRGPLDEAETALQPRRFDPDAMPEGRAVELASLFDLERAAGAQGGGRLANGAPPVVLGRPVEPPLPAPPPARSEPKGEVLVGVRAPALLTADLTTPSRALPPELAALIDAKSRSAQASAGGAGATLTSSATAPAVPVVAPAAAPARTRGWWIAGGTGALVVVVALAVAGGVASEKDGAAEPKGAPAKRTTIEPVKITLDEPQGPARTARDPAATAEVPEPPAGEEDEPRAEEPKDARGVRTPRPRGPAARRETAARDANAANAANAAGGASGSGAASGSGGARAAALRAAATAKKAAQAPTGYLNVGAKPWAEITIDGKPWPYQTPQAGIELPAGRHTVTLSNRETKQSKSQVVLIKAGEYTTLSVDLRKR